MGSRPAGRQWNEGVDAGPILVDVTDATDEPDILAEFVTED